MQKQAYDIYSKKDLMPWERDAEFSLIKSEFYDFVINVNIPWGESLINFDSEKIHNFYVSSLENPSKFYSYSNSNFEINTGYNVNKNTMVF